MSSTNSFEVPPALAPHLSRSVGRQRVLSHEGTVLIILHRPPIDDHWKREGVFLLKSPDGSWKCRGERTPKVFLESYRNAARGFDEEFEGTLKVSELFELLDRLVPLRRAARNVHAVLVEAGKVVPDDAELTEWINFAYETERGLDLVYEDIRNAIDAHLARVEEAQMELSKQSLIATDRLNLLVALFLPLATLASVLGMNLSHGLNPHDPLVFYGVTAAGCLLGLGVLRYVRGGRSAQSVSISGTSVSCSYPLLIWSITMHPLTVIPTEEAFGFLPVPGGSHTSIPVVGTAAIRAGFDATCLQQAINARCAPGVSELILNPDAHLGYGAPIGCVLVSPTHIYPGPVGFDIKCSMSLLQFDLPAEAIAPRPIRRALIDAIEERLPTGPGKGQRSVPKSRLIAREQGIAAVAHGATEEVCAALGVPPEWRFRCEDASHRGHDGTGAALEKRISELLTTGELPFLEDKLNQLGSYGGGNHFGECSIVHLLNNERAQRVAKTFGLKEGSVAFLSHCGSRGFGYALASRQFRILKERFESWAIPFPGGDKELVYAPIGSPEADEYLDDLALGGNFATMNHLVINALVLEAFQQVFPGVTGTLIYFISHNFARREIYKGAPCWVHRKGATRAFPAGHPELRDTAFADVGHPILLPGNPRAGSMVMVAEPGAERTCFSINHGAGRALGRREAIRTLDQRSIDDDLASHDVLTNCRNYPKDEAPAAYKSFDEVLSSVEKAGLASPVASLHARFVIKDAEEGRRR